MRTLLLIPAMLILTAAGGMGLCGALGWTVSTAAMTTAGAIVLTASVLALLPVLLARHATQLGMSQAALGATMIHLFASVGAAAVVVMGNIAVGSGFLYWLMAFYWMTLIALVVILVRAVKSAPTATTAATGATTGAATAPRTAPASTPKA